MNSSVTWLRISYWTGAVVDALAALLMVFPNETAPLTQFPVMPPRADLRFALGMAVPLMVGWTLLLLWADRRPIERSGVLPLTALVILGLVLNEVQAVRTGYIRAEAMIPMWLLQAALCAVFLFSYVHARRAVRADRG